MRHTYVLNIRGAQVWYEHNPANFREKSQHTMSISDKRTVQSRWIGCWTQVPLRTSQSFSTEYRWYQRKCILLHLTRYCEWGLSRHEANPTHRAQIIFESLCWYILGQLLVLASLSPPACWTSQTQRKSLGDLIVFLSKTNSCYWRGVSLLIGFSTCWASTRSILLRCCW